MYVSFCIWGSWSGWSYCWYQWLERGSRLWLFKCEQWWFVQPSNETESVLKVVPILWFPDHVLGTEWPCALASLALKNSLNSFLKKYLYLFDCVGLSCSMWELPLWRMDSPVLARGLSFSMACRILVPWPGIEPMSPALQGRFSTTELPGKSQSEFLVEVFDISWIHVMFLTVSNFT